MTEKTFTKGTSVTFGPITGEPMAFRGNDYGVNRPLEIDAAPLGYCLGSACMAWRYVTREDGTRLHGDHGYCGLAGAQS